jgi:hypothetical protein
MSCASPETPSNSIWLHINWFYPYTDLQTINNISLPDDLRPSEFVITPESQFIHADSVYGAFSLPLLLHSLIHLLGIAFPTNVLSEDDDDEDPSESFSFTCR